MTRANLENPVRQSSIKVTATAWQVSVKLCQQVMQEEDAALVPRIWLSCARGAHRWACLSCLTSVSMERMKGCVFIASRYIFVYRVFLSELSSELKSFPVNSGHDSCFLKSLGQCLLVSSFYCQIWCICPPLLAST